MRMTASWFGSWTHRIQGCGAIDCAPKAGSPLIVSRPHQAGRRARSRQGVAWQGRSMPQGRCDDPVRADVSEALVEIKKRAFGSNKETEEK